MVTIYNGKNTAEYLEFYREAPAEILVEVVGICNLRCLGCPQALPGYGELKSKTPFMDFQLFKSILAQAKKLWRPINVGLYHTGEITLLHPGNFDLYTRTAKEILRDEDGWDSVGFYTNGLKLDELRRQAIVRNKINWVRLSFDGGTREAYEKVKVGSDFETVIYNAIALANLAKTSRHQMRLEVILVPYKENEESIQAFHQLWEGTGWKASTGGASNYGGMTEDLMNNRIHKYQKKVRDRYSIPCPRAIEQFSVLVDGKVSLCSFDPIGIKIIGDLRYQTLEEVWNGKARREVIRQQLQDGGKSVKPCKRCSYTEYCGIPKGEYFGSMQ